MRTLLNILFICLLASFAGATLAQTPDGEPPSVEDVCDQEWIVGAGFGLCNAYCEAMDCHCPNTMEGDPGHPDCVPNANLTACTRVRDRFIAVTGQEPPCEAEVVPVCGNGIVEPPETCDDGNTAPGDGCDENCMTETTACPCDDLLQWPADQMGIGWLGWLNFGPANVDSFDCTSGVLTLTNTFSGDSAVEVAAGGNTCIYREIAGSTTTTYNSNLLLSPAESAGCLAELEALAGVTCP